MVWDFEGDLILLTGAGGKQCSFLLPMIIKKWKYIRLVVNSEKSSDVLCKAYPQAEVVRADLTDPEDCVRVLSGVVAIFHVGPSFHPHETEIGYNIIDAAVSSMKTDGPFQHFIYSSVLNTQLRKLLHHNRKRYVEEYLMESGLNYTILQPSHFMDNFPIQNLLSEPSPVYTARWDPDIPFSYTSLQDAGEVAAKVLEEGEKHYLAQYPLVSTSPPMGYREVCRIAGEKIGKEIKVEQMPFQKLIDGKTEAMFGLKEDPSIRDTAQRMILYYTYHGLVGNANVMTWLLGRKPTSWEDLVEGKMRQTKSPAGGYSGYSKP